MEVIRSALLPRRITQIYTDTKKFYEQIVQEHVTNPQISSLHLKLRIQKDRLVAWGIEWADSNAQQGDIDNSLDRAGISDLVASIMSSIRELLDDAEKVQPSFQPPGRFPDQKGGFLSMPNREWSSEDLTRLGDLVTSITTSIDTLCDLSRSTQAIREDTSFDGDKKKPRTSPRSSIAQSRSSTPIPYSPTTGHFPPLGVSMLVTSTRIDPKRLVYPQTTSVPPAQPPSYDLVTASPENRKVALLKPLGANGGFSMTPQLLYMDTPVLVDFGYDFDYSSNLAEIPALRRYESLVLALQASERGKDDVYTGCLRIIGWTLEVSQSRFGFVYEIPSPNPLRWRPQFTAPSPPTLLSFLQHSGNTDTENLPSLEDRFRLALNLVTNLLHTHAKGVTHRHINSNNVIFIEGDRKGEDRKPWKEGIIRRPYLVSWDQCPGDAINAPEEMHVARLYRHPNSRVGARSTFTPEYDVYSLGLVLLEIGLWMPLHKLWKTKYNLPVFRKKLQSTYAHKLGGKCGSAYMRVVEYCLHAADIEAIATPSHRLSQDYQQAKKQEDFYWKALKPLEKCCLIDNSNDPVLHPFSSMAASHFGAATDSEIATTTAKSSTVDSSKAQTLPAISLPEQSPEHRLEADSPTDRGLTFDVLVWSFSLPPHVCAYYDEVMMPKLNRMFARAINRWESYELYTFMAGDSPENAKPTIYMSCINISRAWKILHYVNNERNYFDIKVSVGQVCYSKSGKKRGRRPKKKPTTALMISRSDPSQGSGPTKYQRKPSCGASIGAFVDEQHLEAVTFGGIVLADGEPYGMSVHHMLEDQDVDHGLDYVLGQDPPDGEASQAKTHPIEEEDEFDPSILDQDFGDEDEECFNLGDTLGTLPGNGRDQVITQPALDDVDPDFFPNEDDMSDEHLSSHGLGYVHASSGMKQVRHGNVSHEVDWALFRVCEGRLEPRNRVDGGDKYGPNSHPCNLLGADALGNREVYAIGATSGLATGKILPKMVATKMPGRVFATPVWIFNGDFGGKQGLFASSHYASSGLIHILIITSWWRFRCMGHRQQDRSCMWTCDCLESTQFHWYFGAHGSHV